MVGRPQTPIRRHHRRVIAFDDVPFCASCTRTRLSADGKHLFLSIQDSSTLTHPDGASDEELAELWKVLCGLNLLVTSFSPGPVLFHVENWRLKVPMRITIRYFTLPRALQLAQKAQ